MGEGFRAPGEWLSWESSILGYYVLVFALDKSLTLARGPRQCVSIHRAVI